MKIEEKSALLVIDIQQEDFVEMNESNMDAPEWECIRNGKRVLDVFREKSCLLSKSKRFTDLIW